MFRLPFLHLDVTNLATIKVPKVYTVLSQGFGLPLFYTAGTLFLSNLKTRKAVNKRVPINKIAFVVEKNWASLFNVDKFSGNWLVM